MIAALTPRDKKTLIALFIVLTIATVIDIGQDMSNHQEADKDRTQLKDMVALNTNVTEKNNNITQIVTKELINSSVRSMNIERLHHEMEGHIDEIRKIVDDHSQNVTDHAKLLDSYITNKTK